MTERYCFGNARFATRSDGKVAIRWWDEDPARMRTWETRGGWKSDEEMADEGWVPVPSQAPGRTITLIHYQKIIDDTSVPYGAGFTDGFHQAGGSIVDDPEPTNLQRLTQAIRDWEQGRGADRILARHLDAIGVKSHGGGE